MRLIDADALLKQIPAVENWDEKVSLLGTTADFICMICDAPTIKAKPVVHAHWNADGRCTNCGGHAPFFAYADDWFETKYCPHCGAQMDKVASDNNVGSKGVKIPVFSTEDVPKIMKEMEK